MDTLVNIDVASLEEAVAFYTRAFELRVGRRLMDFVVDDIESAVARALAANATLEGDITTRIHARSAPRAVVLRRGPSGWAQVIAWDTERDTFDDGAWFKGRIYEERCDLSPNGKLLLYFCHGGRMRPGYTDSWTAVSRAS